MTGTKVFAIVACRIALTSSASVGSSSRINFSPIVSSTSASSSIISVRFSLASSTKLAGMSSHTTFSPLSPSNFAAFMVIRSTHPSSLSSSPIGICTAAAFKCSFSRSCPTIFQGSEPMRSILLMNAMRGTLYRFICRSTVLVCD